MKYSVFNESFGTYSIYEGPPRNPTMKLISSLGSTPESSTDVLPVDSEYIGDSEYAVGTIVSKDYSIKKFFFNLSVILVGGIIIKMIFK